MCKEVRFRDAQRILTKNGFVLNRVKGSHYYYVKDNHNVAINLKLNRMVWQRIKKEHDIVE